MGRKKGPVPQRKNRLAAEQRRAEASLKEAIATFPPNGVAIRKVGRISTLEQLEALPEDEWVEVAGLDFESVFVVPLPGPMARALRHGPKEYLDTKLRGRNLEITIRPTRDRLAARGRGRANRRVSTGGSRR